MRFTHSVIGAVFLSLAACSSAPSSVQYYTLSHVEPSFNASATTRLVIEPVQVAAFLSSNALIFQKSAVELVPTQQHQWAEPLDQQLTRRLQAELSKLKPQYQVTHQAHSPQDLRLTVYVSQFHISQSGEVLLSARLQLLDGVNLTQQSLSVQVPLTQDGYGAAVEALGRGWSELTAKLSETF